VAVSRLRTWSAGDILLASDLNAEFNNILTNGTAVAFPLTSAQSAGGFAFYFDAANTQAITSGAKGLLLSINTALNDAMTTVASTTTPDIWTTVGGVVNYTGTNTATGFASAPQAGARRLLVCAGAAVFTAGANVLIAGVTSGNNYTAATDDVIEVIALTTTQFLLEPLKYNGTSIAAAVLQSLATTKGDTLVATGAAAFVRLGVGSDGQSLVANSNVTVGVNWASPVLRSYLTGCTLSTAGGSGTMSIAAGVAVDSTNVSAMVLAAIAKTTSGWAVGTAQGGLDTGSIANTTWYHFYVIQRTDTGVVDVLFSLSATSPTMPTSYTLKRRIGSGLTDGSAHWTAFVQDGDQFQWAAVTQDNSGTNPGTSALSETMNVPTGVRVGAIVQMAVTTTTALGTAYVVLLSDLSASDQAASSNSGNMVVNSTTGTAIGISELTIKTNTNAQIRMRFSLSDANTSWKLNTKGWIDRRGQDA